MTNRPLLLSLCISAATITGCGNVDDINTNIGELNLNIDDIHVDDIIINNADNLDDTGTTVASDKKLRDIISAKKLTGDPMRDRDIPNISSPKAQLGMRLFFSKTLGGNRDSACVTCHHPALGGGDGLALPIGVGAHIDDLLGPGRVHSPNAVHYDGGPTVPRNAPTTFNIAGWDNVLFHDGRVESIGKTKTANGGDSLGIRTPDSPFGQADPLSGKDLPTAQARFPVTSPEEMKGFDYDHLDNQGIRDYLSSRLGGYGDGEGELPNTVYWLSKFRQVYNAPVGTPENLITEQNIAELIGTYERSQAFVNTPWRKYIEGNDSAISEDAKKGALIFFSAKSDGGANCSSCHSGDFFTDEKFHNIAMPQIGRGKGDGLQGSHDFGRQRETKSDDDLFAFRTPTLTNVEMTGPWSHAGAYSSLESVIRHHLDPEQAVYSYLVNEITQPGIQNLDKMLSNTGQALDKLLADREAGKAVIENIALSDEQIGQLVEFLKALTDPCLKDSSCIGKWIIDPINDIDPNGDQLNTVGTF